MTASNTGAAQRLPPIDPADWTPEQKKVADDIVSGPRGGMPGPFNAWLRSPDLAARFQKVGEYARFMTSLPPALNELAILLVARDWSAAFEWYAHYQLAMKAGLSPAIADARAAGIDATGPIPPDTVFARHRAGEFDGVVAMLHDHGHIAVKTVGFRPGPDGRLRSGGVNVTLGLPIVRTSVDHGTAFDIAGAGVADATSMVEAIAFAARMAAR